MFREGGTSLKRSEGRGFPGSHAASLRGKQHPPVNRVQDRFRDSIARCGGAMGSDRD